MSALVSLVLLFLPSLTISLPSSKPSQTLPQKVNITSTLLKAVTARTRRLQSFYDSSPSNTIEYSKFRGNPSNHLTFGRQDADTTYASPKLINYKPEDTVLKPEVKRYFEGEQDHNTHSDYENYVGNPEGQYHNSDQHWYQQSHPPTYNRPPHPVLVAVKTDDNDDAISKLGLLAILKLVLAKFKTFWIIKFILVMFFFIKVPIVFLKLGLKVLFVLKFFKLLKLIFIPSLIPLILLPLLPLFLLLLLPLLLISLAPLLLAPLLLPLLLPFLLLIPAYIFALRPRPVTPPPPGPPPPPPDQNREKHGSASEDGRAWTNQHLEELLLLTRRVMESEKCLERLACDIGGYHTPRSFSGTVTRLLQIFQKFAPKSIEERLRSYTKAFTFGVESREECTTKFVCRTPLHFKNEKGVIA